LRELAMAGRKAQPMNEWKKYICPFYWLYQIEGEWILYEDQLYTSEEVVPTMLKDSFEIYKNWYANF
jgi:hypothetical protein